MQRSIFLAKLIGPLLAAIGVALIFNADTFRTMAAEFLKSYSLIYLAGLLALTAGLAIVNTHNEWTGDWRVGVTILGLLFGIGGNRPLAFSPRLAGVRATILTNRLNRWILGSGV